jgi:hypothetical protein
MAGVDNPKAIAYAKQRLVDDELMNDVFRKMVDLYGFHKYCPRGACHRARACASPEVVCFWENRSWLQKYVFPELRRSLEEFKSRQRTEDIPPAAPPPAAADATAKPPGRRYPSRSASPVSGKARSGRL